jgi:hypothetical protein
MPIDSFSVLNALLRAEAARSAAAEAPRKAADTAAEQRRPAPPSAEERPARERLAAESS